MFNSRDLSSSKTRFSLTQVRFLTALRNLKKGGFTLIEMLAAIAVLLLLIILVAQITTGAATVVHSISLMDADSESRLVFNRMALDFAAMLKRSDIDYSVFKQPSGILPAQFGGSVQASNLQPGNDQLAFYTRETGSFSGATQPSGPQKAPVSLVAYMIANDPVTNTPALQRLSKGLGWEPDAGGAWQAVAYLPTTLSTVCPDLFDADPDYQSLGYQVFRMEYNYLLKPSVTTAAKLTIVPWNTDPTVAHTCINGFADVSAIVITIVLIDSSSRLHVSNYTGLENAFPDAQEGQRVSASWSNIINSPTFASTAGVSIAAAKGVRIYERYFYLDNLPESVP